VRAMHRGRAQHGLGQRRRSPGWKRLEVGDDMWDPAVSGCAGWRRLAGPAGPADGLRARLSGLQPVVAAAGLERLTGRNRKGRRVG
jgi:hypothetical protein